MIDFKRFLVDTGKLAFENNGGEDFLPTVVIEAETGEAMVMLLLGGHPYDMVLAAIPALQEHKPTTVSITVDSYYGTDTEVYERYGGWARAFQAGDPGVTEALSIIIVTPDSTDQIILPYTREDDGFIVWYEQIDAESVEVGGRMPDALRLVWS